MYIKAAKILSSELQTGICIWMIIVYAKIYKQERPPIDLQYKNYEP